VYENVSTNMIVSHPRGKKDECQVCQRFRPKLSPLSILIYPINKGSNPVSDNLGEFDYDLFNNLFEKV